MYVPKYILCNPIPCYNGILLDMISTLHEHHFILQLKYKQKILNHIKYSSSLFFTLFYTGSWGEIIYIYNTYISHSQCIEAVFSFTFYISTCLLYVSSASFLISFIRGAPGQNSLQSIYRRKHGNTPLPNSQSFGIGV